MPGPAATQGQARGGSEVLTEQWLTLFIAEELDQMAFKGLFQLQGFDKGLASFYHGFILSAASSLALTLLVNKQVGHVSLRKSR